LRDYGGQVIHLIACRNEKDFFFEKKKQKTFAWLSRAYPADLRQGVKVFWFFFSKKNMLPKPPSHKPP
jgi:hypothetical protein